MDLSKFYYEVRIDGSQVVKRYRSLKRAHHCACKYATDSNNYVEIWLVTPNKSSLVVYWN